MANVIKPVFKERYGNFIEGNLDPIKGQYFDNPSPIDGKSSLKQQNQLKKM
jgi:aldehyde dehydrogenase (NAD+)/aldehyde dehydrogenase